MRTTVGQYATPVRHSEDFRDAENAVGPLPDRQPAICKASLRLAKAVETLSSELGGLSSRLSPVLGEDFPSGTSEAKAGCGIPLADSIAAEAARVEAMIDRVRNLSDRLGL